MHVAAALCECESTLQCGAISLYSLTKRLVREAEEKLVEYTHPDPYVIPYMPGGSKFMRNPPPPFEVRHHQRS